MEPRLASALVGKPQAMEPGVRCRLEISLVKNFRTSNRHPRLGQKLVKNYRTKGKTNGILKSAKIEKYANDEKRHHKQNVQYALGDKQKHTKVQKRKNAKMRK